MFSKTAPFRGKRMRHRRKIRSPGRPHFWSDSASGKVAVNSASEGVLWDTPAQSERARQPAAQPANVTPLATVAPPAPTMPGAVDYKSEAKGQVKLAEAEVSVRSGAKADDGMANLNGAVVDGTRFARTKQLGSGRAAAPDEAPGTFAFITPNSETNAPVSGPEPALKPAAEPSAGAGLAGFGSDSGITRKTVAVADGEAAKSDGLFERIDTLSADAATPATASAGVGGGGAVLGIEPAAVAPPVADPPANEDFLAKNFSRGGRMAGADNRREPVAIESPGEVAETSPDLYSKMDARSGSRNSSGSINKDFGIAPDDALPAIAVKPAEEPKGLKDQVALGFEMKQLPEAVDESRFGKEVGQKLAVVPDQDRMVRGLERDETASGDTFKATAEALSKKKAGEGEAAPTSDLAAVAIDRAKNNTSAVNFGETGSQRLSGIDNTWAAPVQKFTPPAKVAELEAAASAVAKPESPEGESLGRVREFDVDEPVSSKRDEKDMLFGGTDHFEAGKVPYFRDRGFTDAKRSLVEAASPETSEPLAQTESEDVKSTIEGMKAIDLAGHDAGKIDGKQVEEFALGDIPLVGRMFRSKAESAPANLGEPVADSAPALAPAPAEKPAELAKLESLHQQIAPKDSGDDSSAPKPALPAPEPQPEIPTSANAFSTFSLNVSDVAFKLAAASLEKGQMPELATVRSEEFVNAFDYRDPEPTAGAPLAFASELARYPFAQNRDLLRLSVKTAATGREPGRPLNLVLLLDNSGSMERADRVRILHEALRVLSAQLQPQDKLSIITFARTPRLWADGVAGDKAGETTARVSEITPQGGTNLSAALDLGYDTALRHYQPGSINRVVLLTDGAANLGDVNPDALKQKVEANRQKGVALDCFGVGWEGYDDSVLEALSRHGDGRYGFINSPEEAATEFAAQLAGALRVAASDVKVQVEWNPRRVTAYRQIGYAKHQLTKEQFRDNTVDAAEIGAAESGNALYVVEVNPSGEGELATVRVRFKVPGTSDYKEHEWTVPYTPNVPSLDQASPALRLAGTASAFSEWLVSSPFATEVTPDLLLGLLNGVPAVYGSDPRPQKLEWMIRTAKNVSGR